MFDEVGYISYVDTNFNISSSQFTHRESIINVLVKKENKISKRYLHYMQVMDTYLTTRRINAVYQMGFSEVSTIFELDRRNHPRGISGVFRKTGYCCF